MKITDSWLIRTIDAVANHVWINLAFGLTLFASGVSETLTDLDNEFVLKSHHGILLLGLAHAFRSLSMILKSLKQAESKHLRKAAAKEKKE